jgi:beta-lactamase family protein
MSVGWYHHVRLDVEQRIRRIENGLLMPVVVKGEPQQSMRLTDRMRFYKMPGASIAFISNGRIEWARGYGVREAGSNGPITTETRFQAGSISKAVTAIAALRLVEMGKLRLDEDVNRQLLSWKIPENEFTKEKKVTLRGLLSHSAGINVPNFIPGYCFAHRHVDRAQTRKARRISNRGKVAKDFIHVEQGSQAGGARLCSHPAQSLIEKQRDKKHSLSVAQMGRHRQLIVQLAVFR